LKRASFTIFKAVVHALVLREIQTRFGSQKLGYLWAIVDPMAQIIVFASIKALLFGGSMPGIDYPVFLATGFLAYDLFKHITLRSMDAFKANKGLFVYKQVKPFDTLVARTIIEVLITSVATTIFLCIGLYFGFDLEVKDLNMVILGFLWIALFGFSLGILFAVLATFYENFAKIIRLIFMPLMFVSALFYTVESLPPIARDFILLNPVIHFIELIHGSYFPELETTYVDFTYMTFWTLIPLYFGLWLYKRSEQKIVMS